MLKSHQSVRFTPAQHRRIADEIHAIGVLVLAARSRCDAQETESYIRYAAQFRAVLTELKTLGFIWEDEWKQYVNDLDTVIREVTP